MRIVRLPKFFTWVGVICGAIFIVLMIMVSISYLMNGNTTARDLFLSYVVFGALTLISLALIAAGRFWRIEYNHHGFTYTTFLKRKTRYAYSDIRGVHNLYIGMIVRTNKRTLFLDPTWAMGAQEFLKFLNAQK